MQKADDERKPFTFDSLMEVFRSVISRFPDKRTGDNKRYALEDAALGAFSIFFTQSPSFLTFQKAMQQTKGENNAQTLFAVHQIPSNNHIRDLLDVVSPSHAFPVFNFIVDGINEIGYLDNLRSINNDLLIPLDGTTYFTSKKICCEKCSTKNHKDGTVTYSHSAITPVIVTPDNNKVISLPPEFITPQDGHKKQDCENAAAKRWIHQHGPRYKTFGVTIMGDDLYCHQPLCVCILNEGLNFLLVCKPDSHKILYEWVKELDAMGKIQTLVVKRWTGKRKEIDTYRGL